MHDELRQFFVKLLRKTRKSVQPDKLDSALAKFCYTYSAQDAWELERFGYKKASLPVKLRVLKEVLESQFDKNPNFRTLVSAQTAAELRSQPLGKDKLGNAYWSTVDDQCNLRIYQEHLDEEIWKVVATNREEMAKLIACLRGNELVMPSLVGLIDEDSSSNSMPPKVDALQNENGNGTTNSNDSDEKNVPCLKIKLNSNGAESTVEEISNGDHTNGAKNQSQNDSIGEEEEEEDASVMSEIDELSQAASESSNTTAGTKSTETQGSKRISLMASKPPSNANKLKLRIFATDKKTLKRNLDEDTEVAAGKNKRPTMQDKSHGEENDSEFESDELSDEELDDISGDDDDDDDDDDEVGPAIEEPTMYVKGHGSGADNNCENVVWPDCDESDCEVGEAIEEEVFFVFGQGSGFECDVGNNDIKTTEAPASGTTAPPPPPVTQSKPMFFFGQAGCLKLSPMKPSVTPTDNSCATNKNDTETKESEKTLANKTDTNDTNSVALDAKSETVPENSADETDKGISTVIEAPPLTTIPENNVGDKNEHTSSSNDWAPISESTAQIETDQSNVNTDRCDDKSADVKHEETTAVAATTKSDSSKESIESNSSVALANISVQQDSESIEPESLPTTSETVLQTESHLSNDTNEQNEISDKVEKQSSKLDVASDDVKSIETENEPEHKLSEMSSEIDVNESNALENDNENENQSSVSQVEDEAKPSAEVEISDTPLTREDVPIENQTISSKHDEFSETIESTSEPVQDTDSAAAPIENDITPLVEENRVEEVAEQTESGESSELNNESNNDVKTESLNEQNVIESNAVENNLKETSTSEEITTAEIQEPESKVSQITPPAVENPVEIPIQTPSEQLETVQPTETEGLPDEQETLDEKLPSTYEEIEQTTSEPEPIDALPIAVAATEPTPIESDPMSPAPVYNESSEPIPNEVVNESVPSSVTEPIAAIASEPIPSEQIEPTPNACPSETVENAENDNKEIVSVDDRWAASVSVPVAEAERQETSQAESERKKIVPESKVDRSEVIATEVISAPITEKRKSIDCIEEVSECKKICEEKILEEPEQPTKIDLDAVKINEIPTTSQEESVSKPLEIVEQSDTIHVSEVSLELEATIEPSQIELSKLSEESELIAQDKEDAPQITTETQIATETNVEIRHKTSKSEQPNLSEVGTLKTDDSVKNAVASVEKGSVVIDSEFMPKTQVNEAKNEEPEYTQAQENVAEASTEAPVAIEKEKSRSPARAQLNQAQSSRVAQLRTRKRRISGEKVRHSSESDDNIDALIESPLSQDASSDEEVGGKRIKMRPKVVKRSVRKSVEQKRNIKDTDWSSDDNEKPNAKRATSDVSKETEKILPSPEKVAPEVDRRKAAVKEKSPPSIKPEEKPSVVEETTVKFEEEAIEQQSDEGQATPVRRPGRPTRRGRKPGPKPKAKPVIKNEDIKEEEPLKQNQSIKEDKPAATPPPPAAKPETRRKKRSLLGLDIAEIETAQAAVDADTPVRQSRRIAQIKIREEAERRKAEEVALIKMKQASEKKKKGVVAEQSATEDEEEEENSESEAKLEKKKKRKKGNKDKPWQTDSDDSSEREEEDVYEHEEVERLPPLGSDHEFSPESDIEDESQIVPTKRARTARKDKTERREEESEEEEDIHACQKCTKSDHPEWILLCDKCDKGYHCSCLNPVLFVIPEGDWFCPPCQQEKLIDHLEVKLLEFDNMLQQKEIEEAQRQRLLMTTISEENVIRDTKRDRQRARALDGSENSSESSSEEESDAGEKVGNSERRTRQRPRPRPRPMNRQRNRSESESEASSSDNSSDNEPIYKLRKRRQANVSYRFNEYDELINRAIKSEMDEVAGAGNLGRGKDISTIIEADKEEKRLKKLEEQQKEREITGETNEKDDDDDSDDHPLKTKAEKSDDSDSEPIRPKAIKRSKNVGGRKKKKLNSLDVDSEEDADSSDDDFNTSSYSDDEEEEDSSAPSESSLDSIVKKKRGKGRQSTRRSVRDRKKRFDADFIDDSSFDDEDNIPLVKKKKKVESDFDDFDDSSEELGEDVDSEDLCDDSTDESDRSWGKKKKKPSNKVASKPSRKKKPDGERSFKGKIAKKEPKVSNDDDDDDDDVSDDDDADEVLPESRRTRGKKLPYLLDDDFDSSDDGIKPGVKRPDTPPEERAAFIKKQEEIKRMLAEKGNDDKSLRVPPPQKDSLSTIPPQIIQTAKALDVDLKKSASLNRNASDNDSNGFDDDLPEDFDPEDMDEDAIAKMMEEEEFAQHQLKLAGETIRNRKLKDALTDPMKKEDSPTKLTIETGSSVIMQSTIPSLVSPLSTSQLTIPDIPPSMYTVSQFQGANSKQSTTPKKRGRKTKDDVPMIGVKEQVHPTQLPTIQHTSILPPNKPNTLLNMPSVLQHAPTSQLFASPTIQHTSSVIAHASVIQQQQRLPPMPQTVASSILGLAQNREPIIPSTVLDVQNTRLLDPSELGKPPDALLDPAVKKRARSRKKITPTRDSLITSPPNVTVSPGIIQPSAVTIPNVPNISKPPSSILSERLSANPAEKAGLSVATPPQLYSPSSRSQASVITRLTRPSQRQPFPSGQSPPQRYYAPNATMPSHSIPSTATGSLSRPYHTPNVTVTSGPRPPPLVPPPHTSGHLPHPMYMRGQPGIPYGGYPNIQPPPMHRSLQSIEHATNSPQNFTGAYQNLPFGSYYAAAQAAAERRSGAIIGTFEPFDNKNPASHDRLPAYAHPSLGLAALASRNAPTGNVEDDRTGPPGPAPPSVIGPGGVGGVGGSTSEFSGLVSYFSSQQDDLDS
ncbi:A-kinase anchor protein 12-like isoform X2 [Sitodiplosis mosellana]|uniref:A-kinase anchor protein 12-like isoform X2 n=1 Tax=Sitodiplosis mosellana TaxID=263140 RepID=UPI002444A75F|nr:A-kinase anchor protein 12-like isoform X2 [Sitodiplosis mosellana]